MQSGGPSALGVAGVGDDATDGGNVATWDDCSLLLKQVGPVAGISGQSRRSVLLLGVSSYAGS